ncbi:PREDICTED: uncharacterized protein LOC104588603 [Nelumbo nucifera]|uniref:Uncharacterized protein LOC104588603 n=2 Tax=Nelumbo nucifera TaxID=4432 RepID=A0A1U7YWP3_NELNU|nr:PREDICTED: uncharacterized protein LOC104588603 [Nelumbo nucifera]XP_010244909.1 PREDICTED: uncharacterized protein LOC104588603 [Nelumbo nucifera]XP_010244910.1 PREDICTED: uncharacterized protein LOC104588603 [Nelumbo nucifera]DAD27268.1 TPA_asm: hypothetical protein HUJ06_028736 [Nelumbo nucifera]
MENFHNEKDEFYNESVVMKHKERESCKRGVGDNESEEGVSTGSRCCTVNSSSSFVVSTLVGGASSCGKDCRTNCRSSNSNQTSKNSSGDSGSRTSKHSNVDKIRLRLSAIKQLDMRLQILEEDTKNFREAFLKAIDERNELMNEIGRIFQTMHQCLRNKKTEGKPLECARTPLILEEEDTKNLKEALSGAMDEREELMNEIWKIFQIIHQCLRNQTAVGNSLECDLILSGNEDNATGSGLPQVLQQGASPLLITRVLKINAFTLQHLSGVTQGCSNGSHGLNAIP